jgi:4-alpha-glucanotransferase
MTGMDELAQRWGIETAYFDVQGRHRPADPDILRQVAKALAAPGHSPAVFPQPPPMRAYQGDGQKAWLLAVQLYGVRSRGNWGHGDFSDLASLLELAASIGGAGVGLNPLHALLYDRPGAASPYSPSSRLFLNPLYIDVEAIEEFNAANVAELSAEIERLRSAELVDYAAVTRVKLAAMRAAHRGFLKGGSERRRQDFETYQRERGTTLERFAAFETLRTLHPQPWTEWPKEWRQPHDGELARLRESHAEEIGFHEFLQWNAERQLERCRDVARERGLAVGLYLDTAVGIDGGGADAWMDQGSMLNGLSIGAPPDQYNSGGQDWGLTAFNPHGLVDSRFEAFRQMLRAAMRCAGAVRIDHVMGLTRLFVIPHGAGAQQGVYLRFPLAAMLAVVAEESLRCRCLVIGEDLGTVPENFRQTLSDWGVWSYLVMMFERNGDGTFRRAADYPECALATFNTHDLPSFAGWMSDHDRRLKRELGVDPGENDEERERSRQALRVALKGAESFEGAVGYLAATPTRLVSVAIEDVLGLEDQVNMPGTTDQHPNWRRRWPITLEELASDQRLRRIAATFSRAGRGAPASS